MPTTIAYTEHAFSLSTSNREPHRRVGRQSRRFVEGPSLECGSFERGSSRAVWSNWMRARCGPGTIRANAWIWLLAEPYCTTYLRQSIETE
jgi:hypothetical protein